MKNKIHRIQISDKYMKRCSMSVLIRKMQIKIIKYILLSKLAKIRMSTKGKSTAICHRWKYSL